ncbi:helix-turn-helix domain-containing protein [Thiothrix subterranea]|uniref:Helix-turn-helix domain-containing protein n=1 Tax=Thiothrix subterranea TaxID=2735563 RepID=A0AA51MKX3_9GAMM|nr:helix-turn-helix domain-containing protein [Thiothrix subterranea]MDQ5771001.1 helix-turn-helix domain-containing protein [Thiothrix subterranea]WML85785.1 helix-turn-helix domain-containing protein [Thiothrix subterranea]
MSKIVATTTPNRTTRRIRRNRDAIRRSQIIEQIPGYTINGDPLFMEREAAPYVGFAPRTLEKWRYTHPDRLPHIRIGRSVRYRKSVLDAFLDAHTVTDGRGVRK